ncbi:hypothetical protein KR067_006005 [Drosophila pandora]|nr:hypothetical protein KR067_006005 [Drosophila pandora]
MQSEITNVLTDARHKTISPILISPTQLRDQLDQMRDHLPPDQILPVATTDVVQLYKIMYAQGSTTDTHAIFRITIPLVSSELLDVFSIVPIPIWESKGWTLYNLQTPIIAVNAHRDRFIGFSEDEFKRCTSIKIEQHICFNHLTAYNVDICSGVSSTVNIKATGILKLPIGCTARNFNISLTTFGTMTTEVQTSFSRFGNISEPLKPIEEPSEFGLRAQSPSIDDTELEILQHRLADLQRKDAPYQLDHQTTMSYTAFAISVIILILIGIFIMRHRRSIWTPKLRGTTRSSIPEPTPRQFTIELDDG